MLKHATDAASDAGASFWSTKGGASGGGRRVKVKVLKDRPAFGVFDGATAVWVSDQ